MKTRYVIGLYKPNYDITLFINTEFWCIPFGLYIHKFKNAGTLSFCFLCFGVDVFWFQPKKHLQDATYSDSINKKSNKSITELISELQNAYDDEIKNEYARDNDNNQ